MNITFDCRAIEYVELQNFYSSLQTRDLYETNAELIEDKIKQHKEGLEKVLNDLD